MKQTIISILFCLLIAPVAAQQTTFEIRGGFSVGGTSPLPMPKEIRHIDGFNPDVNPTVELNITHWVKQHWGITSGIRCEVKGMTTKARVKNYSMEIVGSDGNRMKGNWTGGNQTRARNIYAAVPLLATYRLSDRVNVRGGLYAAFLMNGTFKGKVYEGYLRKDNPTGDKVNFTDESIATYDFSNHLSKFSWGAEVGAGWKASRRWNVYSELTWGFNNIFEKDFDTITFNMYPIYLNIGVGYDL
ncbi:porin family protein [Phocaeicola oris]|uniref:porin family protein n=1 Tax=Phocaeicola oris TaxID=2896850 RepID=UPI00234EF875|nr:porin family protein [Phocaeicola oris]MCE2616164.1 PorT family protein [Phocaeicola oris]